MKDLSRKFMCLACGYKWKVPFNSERQLVCPECGAAKVKRTNPQRRRSWKK